MSRIEEAMSSEDAEGLERAAHSLKGALTNLGAERSSEIARELERFGCERDLEGTKDAYERLDTAIEDLRKELDLFRNRVLTASS